MSEALIAPTYGEVFELRRQFRQLYSGGVTMDYLFATVTPTAAQLEIWLATDANLAAYQRLVSTAVGASAVCASAPVAAAVAGSTTALATMRDSDAGRAALLNSKTALTAVLASATASAAVVTNRAFLSALYDSENAWAAWVASANGRNALNGIAQETSLVNTTHTYPPGLGHGVRVILTQQKAVGTTPLSHAGQSADTYVTSSQTYIDRYVRITGLTHRTNGASTTSWLRYVVL